MQFLIGDIGGTNSRLALIEDGKTVARRTVPSVPDEPLLPKVQAFLQANEGQIQAACLAVAGPVRLGKVNLPALGWSLDEADWSKTLGVPVKFINDFTAVALAVPHLKPEDLVEIGGDGQYADLPIAVLGAGTGLGEAILVPQDGGKYQVLPTEGGHSAFAPQDAQQCELLETLRPRYDGFVCCEHVISGRGIVSIYEYLRGDEPRHPVVERGDAAAAISRLALEHACPICEAALSLFAQMYGAEASNLALKCWAGAVYVAGNIAQKNLEFIRQSFRKGFVAKGYYREWLNTLPIRVIMHPDPGLLGAQYAAEAMIQ